MGCVSSSQKRCPRCQSTLPPRRSYTHPLRNSHEGVADGCRVVTLPSTEQNFLVDKIFSKEDDQRKLFEENQKTKDFSTGLIEAKTWSEMIDQKIPKIVPKTPTRTPPGEPETINTWELMEGLEDVSPLLSPSHFRSFSFNVGEGRNHNHIDYSKSSFQDNGTASMKPMWLQVEEDDRIVTEFDPEMIASFRKSLEALSPDNSSYIRPSSREKQGTEAIDSKKISDQVSDSEDESPLSFNAKERGDRVIVYFTSLRGIRKTYENCCNVLLILKGLSVRIEERDVSMHSGFKDELRELLGDEFNGGGLPRVFVGRQYIGGPDEIRILHEDGQLEKVLEFCEKVDEDGEGGGRACEVCGDMRFVPCETCSGSCKVYNEAKREDDDDEEEEAEDAEFGFQRCPDCNENGLIRCPLCCSF